MENAADALKMAGSVLLFVIALSVAILSFSQARETIDAVLKFSDRESLMIENDERFYYLSNSSDTNRYVGKETIIPAIYRAYEENYKIVFTFPNNEYYLFKTSDGKEIYTIDLTEKSADKQFLDGIIFKNYEYEPGKTKEQFEQRYSIQQTNNIGLFEYLTSKETSYRIKEHLGTYYIDDLKDNEDDDRLESDVQDVNKQEKRVITYEFVSI